MIKRTKKNSNRKTISEMIKRRRVIKEQEDRKEINTMQELVDYLDDEFHLVDSADDLEGLDSWSSELETGGIANLKINAHTDDDGVVWFGCDYVKQGMFDADKDWAEDILRYNRVSNSDRVSEDDIREMVGEAVDEMLRSDDSYFDGFSKDVKLPCSKKAIDNEIRRGKDYIDEIAERCEGDLIHEVEELCREDGILAESKKNSKRKALKEARMAGLEEHPTLKKLVSRFKEDDQWALSRIIYALDANLPRLDSEDEREVLNGLEAIFGTVDDIAKLKKKFKKITFGQRMWL